MGLDTITGHFLRLGFLHGDASFFLLPKLIITNEIKYEFFLKADKNGSD